MKQLSEEKGIEDILKKVKTRFPFLRIPGPEEIDFFTSARYAGWGGDKYGVSINVNILNKKDELLITVVHELVHYQGIMGHGKKFNDMFNYLMNGLANYEKTWNL